MRKVLFLFFVLNIYTLIFLNIYCQEIKLTIEGADTTSDSIINLTSYQKYHTSQSSILEELNLYNNRIQKQGYLDIESSTIKQSDSIYKIHLRVGKLYKTISLKYKRDRIENYLKELEIPFTKNTFNIEFSKIELILQQLAELESDNGHPLSYFTLSDIKKRNSSITAILNLKTENQKRTIDSILVKGYNKFPKSFFKNYAGLKKGQLYNQASINKKSKYIEELSFVSQSREPEILFNENKTSLYYYLSKKQGNKFDGYIGFRNTENDSKLKLNGYLDLYLLNNLNYGESLKLNYRNNGDDQTSLNILLDLPYIANTPLSSQVEFELFRQDSSFTITTQRVSLDYQINHSIKLGVFGRFENSTETRSSLTIPDALSSYSKSIGGLSFELEKTQNISFLEPQKNLQILLGVGNRKENNITTPQQLVTFKGQYTFELHPKHHFHINNDTKILFSKNYFTNELFRFGGINSIRGFVENSLYANLYTAFSSEYRFKPVSSLYIHSIVDAAYYENKNQSIEEALISFGLGAAILTNGGVLRINFANGLKQNLPFKLTNSILHLQYFIVF